jgi:hypothetical protein
VCSFTTFGQFTTFELLTTFGPFTIFNVKKNKKHHTLGTIPKSTTSILVAWYRYFNVNEQKFQASPQNVQC